MARPRSGVRVIAGTAKGRRLDTPPGLSTRPVTDRVKESVFGSLEPRLADAAVLDLYAGSGAMAIEALSRGAAEALLVERDGEAAALIDANLERTGFGDASAVVRSDVRSYLRRAPRRTFDVVFVDPPYAAPDAEVEEVLGVLAEGWLAPEAIVVIRRQRRSPQPALPEGLEFTRVRNYGDTVVLVAAAT